MADKIKEYLEAARNHASAYAGWVGWLLERMEKGPALNYDETYRHMMRFSVLRTYLNDYSQKIEKYLLDKLEELQKD